MKWEEVKKKKEAEKERIRAMTDTEKLHKLMQLVKKEDNISMLTECSDTHGINFTEEYQEWQNEMEELVEILDEE